MNETNKINSANSIKQNEYNHNFKLNRSDKKNVHFSKNILEILNKSIVASSRISQLYSENCWINNENFYKIIEQKKSLY